MQIIQQCITCIKSLARSWRQVDLVCCIHVKHMLQGKNCTSKLAESILPPAKSSNREATPHFMSSKCFSSLEVSSCSFISCCTCISLTYVDATPNLCRFLHLVRTLSIWTAVMSTESSMTRNNSWEVIMAVI